MTFQEEGRRGAAPCSSHPVTGPCCHHDLSPLTPTLIEWLHCHPLGGTQPDEWGVMSRPSKAETLPKLLVIFRPGGVLLLPRLLIN